MGVILYPLTTEKAVAGIETQNALTFIVDNSANKKQIREAIEKQFSLKVKKVTTCVTSKGMKKAVVKFHKPGAAADLAAKLKLV